MNQLEEFLKDFPAELKDINLNADFLQYGYPYFPNSNLTVPPNFPIASTSAGTSFFPTPAYNTTSYAAASMAYESAWSASHYPRVQPYGNRRNSRVIDRYSHLYPLPGTLYSLGLHQAFNPAALRPKNPYICDLCGKSYASNSTLKRHRKLECGKDPANKCHICSYATHQHSNLKRHLKSIHSIQSPPRNITPPQVSRSPPNTTPPPQSSGLPATLPRSFADLPESAKILPVLTQTPSPAESES